MVRVRGCGRLRSRCAKEPIHYGPRGGESQVKQGNENPHNLNKSEQSEQVFRKSYVQNLHSFCEACDELGYRWLSSETHEADDLIATCVPGSREELPLFSDFS